MHLRSTRRPTRSRLVMTTLLTAVLTLLLPTVLAAPAKAAPVDVDGITYELVNDSNLSQGAIITGYDPHAHPSHPHLVIPETVEIDGQTVTVRRIPGGIDTPFPDQGLESVQLPESITHLNTSAFVRNDLREVVIPASLRHIGGTQFTDNPNLETVRFLGAEPRYFGSTTSRPIAPEGSATNPEIEFLWRHYEQAPSGARDGFWPTWYGFDAVPLLEVTFADPEHGVTMPDPMLVRMEQTGSDGQPFGLVPDPGLWPSHPDPHQEFNGWLLVNPDGTTEQIAIGARLHADAELRPDWVDMTPGGPNVPLHDLEVSTSATEITAGDTIDLAATLHVTLGGVPAPQDATSATTFAATDPSITIEDNRITFTEPGTFVISGAIFLPDYGPFTDTTTVTVLPAGSSTDATDPESAAPQTQAVLPATGVDISPASLMAAVAALFLGAALLARARRYQVG